MTEHPREYVDVLIPGPEVQDGTTGEQVATGPPERYTVASRRPRFSGRARLVPGATDGAVYWPAVLELAELPPGLRPRTCRIVWEGRELWVESVDPLPGPDGLYRVRAAERNIAAEPAA